MASGYTNPSFLNFLIAVAIDAALATLVFRHAHRRGNRNATAWGVFTFLAALVAIPLYFLTYSLRRRVVPSSPLGGRRHAAKPPHAQRDPAPLDESRHAGHRHTRRQAGSSTG